MARYIGLGGVAISPDDKRSRGDFYPTPACATEALLRVTRFDGPVWEPAVGKGHISDVLISHGYQVIESDLHADELGRGDKVDFLNTTSLPDGIKTVITNPPYSLLDKFIFHAINLNPDFLIMHTAVTALGGKTRGRIFNKHKPSLVVIISNKLKIETPKGIIISIFNHAWFVWERGKSDTILKWVEAEEKCKDHLV